MLETAGRLYLEVRVGLWQLQSSLWASGKETGGRVLGDIGAKEEGEGL